MQLAPPAASFLLLADPSSGLTRMDAADAIPMGNRRKQHADESRIKTARQARIIRENDIKAD